MSLKNTISLFILIVCAFLAVSSVSLAADEVIAIRYLTHSVLEEPSRTIILDGIKRFEELHPNIKIEIEAVPNEQVSQKVVTYARSGMLPDIVGLQAMGIEPMASEGHLLDITDRVMADKLDEEFFDLECATGLDGKIYGLPLYGATDALYSNPELFKSVGLDPNNPPKTWDELLNYAIQLTNPEIGQYGMGLYGKPVHAIRVEHYMSNAGPEGRILKLNREKNNTWDILVNSPDSLKAWRYLRGFIDEGAVPPNTAELTYPDLISLFAQGKVAMITTGPWGMATIKAANPDATFNVSQHPTPTGEMPTLRVAPLVTAISANTQHPEEAYEFLKFLTIDIGVEMAAAGYGALTKSAANDPRVKDNPFMNIFAEQQKYAYFSAPEMLLPEWLRCRDQGWGVAWQEMLIGTLTPEEAVNQAAKKIKEILGDKGNLIYPVE